MADAMLSPPKQPPPSVPANDAASDLELIATDSLDSQSSAGSFHSPRSHPGDNPNELLPDFIHAPGISTSDETKSSQARGLEDGVNEVPLIATAPGAVGSIARLDMPGTCAPAVAHWDALYPGRPLAPMTETRSAPQDSFEPLRAPLLPSLTVPPLPRMREPRKCPQDLRVLCRLIAAHDKRPEPGSLVKFTVNGIMHEFRVLRNVDIGQNVRCLVFEVEKGMAKAPAGNLYRKSQIIFAFNWFSPKGLWDYLSLGLRLWFNSGAIEPEYNLCSEMAMDQAKQFFYHSAIRDLLHELKLGYIASNMSKAQENSISRLESAGLAEETLEGMEGSAKLSSATGASHSAAGGPLAKFIRKPSYPLCSSDAVASPPSAPPVQRDLSPQLGVHPSLLHVDQIVVTGFSMGGSTAHAFAVLLKELKAMPQELRCVGFGCPRPGNAALTRWVTENLSSDSVNILLARSELAPIDPDEKGPDGSIVSKAGPFFPTPKTLNSPRCSLQGGGCKTNGPCSSSILSKAGDGRLAQTLPDFPADRLYDPVTMGPPSWRGFDIQPNACVVMQEGDGLLFPMSEHERERLKHFDKREKKGTPALSSLFNIATRGSPMDDQHAYSFDLLHSILKYYEALCGLG